MSEQQDVFEVRELATLSCKCSTCGTVVVFDMATEETHGLPKRCSTCNEPLGAAAQAFRDYRTFYNKATELGVTMKLYAKKALVPHS
jgi:NAD-dependent SIR2 family protein deacetylase